jgi:phosphomannomutase
MALYKQRNDMSNETISAITVQQGLSALDSAVHGKRLTAAAAANIRLWLTDSRYAKYVPQVLDHIAEEKWQLLDDVFWTVIPFGTGGRRGKMYPIGCNAINERTIGESAQGLANYLRTLRPNGELRFAIAYDTRHRSREFAELCSSIMVANGFKVFFIEPYRSTPELSFLVRYKKCDCGIMVTASHNPPSDNAVKVYWSTGGQLVPPHDKAVIDQVLRVDEIRVVDFQQAVADGQIEMVGPETDRALLQAHMEFNDAGPRDLRVVYSPLHGVGEFNVASLLAKCGFHDVEVYGPHREPSGDFPNVPGNVSNPENSEVFDAIIRHAQQYGGELILATDPDCDRVGAATPLTWEPGSEWGTLTGNQLGALLIDFVLERMRVAGKLTPEHFTVTTLVTSLLGKRVTESYGAKCYNNNLVGFKWICHVVDQMGAENFVLGTEESYGYLVGTYARDKDGVIACLLLCQLAAKCKAEGITLFQRLEQLYQRHGYHGESTISIFMHGSDGMRRMQALMSQLREKPPQTLAGKTVLRIRDYEHLQIIRPGQSAIQLDGPKGDLVIFDLDDQGNQIAIRPSGTEPKVKFYMFYYQAVDGTAMATAKSKGQEFFQSAERELRAIAESV